MSKQCPVCSSTDLHLSKIRPGDWIRLVLLMYPIRCRDCFRRSFVFLPLAALYKHPAASDQAAKPQKA